MTSPNVFQRHLIEEQQQKDQQAQQTPRNAFQRQKDENESVENEPWYKSLFRYGAQVPQGLAELTGPGIAGTASQLLGNPDLDIEEWHKLRQLAEERGEEFDEEAFQQARQEASGMFPTVSNISSKIEEKTGLPLEPKTRGQKALRYATNIRGALGKAPTHLNPTTLRGASVGLPKTATAAGVTVVKEAGQEALESRRRNTRTSGGVSVNSSTSHDKIIA